MNRSLIRSLSRSLIRSLFRSLGGSHREGKRREFSRCLSWRGKNDYLCLGGSRRGRITPTLSFGGSDGGRITRFYKAKFFGFLSSGNRKGEGSSMKRTLSTSKAHGSTKRRKLDDSAQSSSSYATETTTGEADQGCNRPPGVKASKGHGKKKMAEGKEKQSRMTFSEFESMWSMKKEDLSQKEKLSKMKLLDSLLAKQKPLADYEEALKKKLINELLA
ncbi:hypothetical protein Bca52824_040092 [Brassica carinata]|uniref:No apical meristem-associated C-terminal domain-containing protein n=1 Tax=Brassica carinata TaxID=52824 RepID=A0A8X7RQ97_BRACI|nr:hypothetical protein Bca52824_040092 [Brassica carinata]